MNEAQKVAQIMRERDQSIQSIDEYVDMLVAAVEEVHRLNMAGENFDVKRLQ